MKIPPKEEYEDGECFVLLGRCFGNYVEDPIDVIYDAS